MKKRLVSNKCIASFFADSRTVKCTKTTITRKEATWRGVANNEGLWVNSGDGSFFMATEKHIAACYLDCFPSNFNTYADYRQVFENIGLIPVAIGYWG